MELEGLALGVESPASSRSGRPLRLVAEEEARLRPPILLDRLVERAETQQRQIEERRLKAAHLAFA